MKLLGTPAERSLALEFAGALRSGISEACAAPIGTVADDARLPWVQLHETAVDSYRLARIAGPVTDSGATYRAFEAAYEAISDGQRLLTDATLRVRSLGAIDDAARGSLSGASGSFSSAADTLEAFATGRFTIGRKPRWGVGASERIVYLPARREVETALERAQAQQHQLATSLPPQFFDFVASDDTRRALHVQAVLKQRGSVPISTGRTPLAGSISGVAVADRAALAKLSAAEGAPPAVFGRLPGERVVYGELDSTIGTRQLDSLLERNRIPMGLDESTGVVFDEIVVGGRRFDLPGPPRRVGQRSAS